MERLTKKELRALLECIKECYPICDLETFAQRVVSRLSKIVSPEIIFNNNGVNPRRRRNACATYPLHTYTSSENKILEQRARSHPVIIHHEKMGDTPQSHFHRLGLSNKFHPLSGVKYRTVQPLIKQPALNRKSKDCVHRNRILLNLLSPHLNQAYRNAQTFTHMRQKLTLVDEALYRLNLGLIFLTRDGKIHLATTGGMQQLTNYFGSESLRENRLPESLWRWTKQQEVALKRKDDVPLQRDPLVLAHEGKRLVIHLVSDLNQSLLLLEEHPITTQLQSPVPFGLSPREAQVLGWVSQGKTNKEIGMILGLSPRTVQKHLEHIYEKIGVESRTAAAAKAYEIASIASNRTVMFFLVVSSLIA
jgi:DNA-binding CsgD family transcriptional regulator